MLSDSPLEEPSNSQAETLLPVVPAASPEPEPSAAAADSPIAPPPPSSTPAAAAVSGASGFAHTLEGWARKLPGVAGYIDRELSRDADRTLRQQLADRTETAIANLSNAQRALIDTLQLDAVDDIERLVVKLRKFADGIRTAAYGYGGVFGSRTVGQAELEQLYSHDLHLFTSLETVESEIADLQSNIENGDAPTLNAVNAAARALLADFEKREHLLAGGASSGH